MITGPFRFVRIARFLVLLLIWTSAAAIAEIPLLTGRVNDVAGVLSAETVRSLEAELKAHEDSTSNQVAVLTIPSLDGRPIEEYSIQVVDEWKLGRKEKDNGVLLLVVTGDRKVRIEVGRGLEGDLPDITCGTIIRKEILPRFKEGDYNRGVQAGVDAILGAIAGSYHADEQTSSLEDIWWQVVAFLIFAVVVGVFTVVALVSKGFVSWFLYVFLLPFWAAFPTAILGFVPGITLFGIYAIGFIIIKIVFARSAWGKNLLEKLSAPGFFGAAAGSGFSSFGSGSFGSSSSGGGGFSGGGGGFSGGGASGSW